jgi:hypothetical protein
MPLSPKPGAQEKKWRKGEKAMTLADNTGIPFPAENESRILDKSIFFGSF